MILMNYHDQIHHAIFFFFFLISIFDIKSDWIQRDKAISRVRREVEAGGGEKVEGGAEAEGERLDSEAVLPRLHDRLRLQLPNLAAQPLLRLLRHPEPLPRPLQLPPQHHLPMPALHRRPLQLFVPPPQLRSRHDRIWNTRAFNQL